MYPSNIYKMKNFANPKTMFKSCSNNDEFSTTPVQSCAKRSQKPAMGRVRSGSADSSSGTSYKSIINATCGTTGSCACSPRSEQNGCAPDDSQCGSPTMPTLATTKSPSSATAATTTTKTHLMELGGGAGVGAGTGTGDTAGMEATSNSGSTTTMKTATQGMGTGAGTSEQGKETSIMGATATGDNDGPFDIVPVSGDAVEQLTTEPHHPLNSEWTLWYLETDRSKSWEEMLHEVASFNTVENFWSLINHIKTPSEIKMGSDYCLFKKGIRPMWEDEANVRGGRWVITLNKSNKSDLDNFWLDTLLVLIGESCEYSNELCGAVVNIRGKNNKISIWTANGSNEAAALEIGGKLRDGLRMESAYVLQYQLHKDTMAKQGSLVKTIYTR